MTVRRFDRNPGEWITFAPGDVQALTGPITFVFVWKPTSEHAGGLIRGNYEVAEFGEFGRWGVNPFSDGNAYLTYGAGRSNDYGDYVNDWALLAYSKDAGLSAARAHILNLTDDTQDHADIGDAYDATPSTDPIDEIYIGRWASNELLGALVAAIAVYPAALSDAAIEALAAGAQPMLDAEPLAMWTFDQEDVGTDVEDITGGGADQTAISGTTVVTDDDPPGFDFELGGEEPPPEPPAPTSHTDLWEWLRHQEREGLL
jgi:hypothetical protein